MTFSSAMPVEGLPIVPSASRALLQAQVRQVDIDRSGHELGIDTS